MKVNVKTQESSMRLDVYLSQHMDGLSRSAVKKLIDENLIKVNNNIVAKAGTELKVGDQIEFELPQPVPTKAVAQDIPLNIVYQDEDLLVINKPQGMVVHPANGNYSGTLVNALLYRVKDLSSINGEMRPGIVHRLDKDTSGLMLVAKNNMAHQNLSKQISDKTCIREYQALLEGVLKQEKGEIVTHIGRDPHDRKKMAVLPNFEGREAISDFEVLRHYAHYTLVKFRLKTGRTHQIRVHAKYLGHPVVGDFTYNPHPDKFGLHGQLLHSYYIEFTHPRTGERMHFESDLPDYFNEVLQKLD